MNSASFQNRVLRTLCCWVDVAQSCNHAVANSDVSSRKSFGRHRMFVCVDLLTKVEKRNLRHLCSCLYWLAPCMNSMNPNIASATFQSKYFWVCRFLLTLISRPGNTNDSKNKQFANENLVILRWKHCHS